MAITIKKNNETIVLRNLEEQVQKNKEDIAAHYAIDRVLADFGIRVLGQLESAEDLPEAGAFAYGDSYAIGSEPPYVFYVWTRADVNTGHLEDYWFNIGQLAIQGPQGPQGEQGVQGEQGLAARWYVYPNAELPPVVPENANESDLALTKNGAVYQLVEGNWVRQTSIQGPQGVQGVQGPQGVQGVQGPRGPQGVQGPPGSIYKVIGRLTSTSALPTPTESIRQNAYLVGYDIYAITGDTDLIWTNYGPLDFGSQITVDGQYVQTFEMNTKVNKSGDTMTGDLTFDNYDESGRLIKVNGDEIRFESDWGDSKTTLKYQGYQYDGDYDEHTLYVPVKNGVLATLEDVLDNSGGGSTKLYRHITTMSLIISSVSVSVVLERINSTSTAYTTAQEFFNDNGGNTGTETWYINEIKNKSTDSVAGFNFYQKITHQGTSSDIRCIYTTIQLNEDNTAITAMGRTTRTLSLSSSGIVVFNSDVVVEL